jgi:hypothetical protein
MEVDDEFPSGTNEVPWAVGGKDGGMIPANAWKFNQTL